MREIRLFEAFAGYGSQLMALRRLEKACEWLELHMQCGVHPQNVSSTIKQFKKAMEE